MKLESGLPVFSTRSISSLQIEEQNKEHIIIVCSGFILHQLTVTKKKYFESSLVFQPEHAKICSMAAQMKICVWQK